MNVIAIQWLSALADMIYDDYNNPTIMYLILSICLFACLFVCLFVCCDLTPPKSFHPIQITQGGALGSKLHPKECLLFYQNSTPPHPVRALTTHNTLKIIINKCNQT